MRTRVVILLIALGLPMGAGAQSRDERQALQTAADLRMLQEQIGKLQLLSNQLTEQLKIVNRRLDEQAAANLKTFADLQLLINNLGGTVNTVREKLDDNTVRVSQLMQELPGMRSGLGMLAEQLNTLVGLLQPPAGGAAADAAAPVEGPPSGALGTVRLPDSPARIFDAAKADYASNRLDSAIEGFTEFVQKFPDAPLAAEAQFWIGQSYYQQGKFRDALTAYGKVITNYKNSDQVPGAYYQQGLCYLDLGQRTDARRVFDLIVRQYPNSTESTLATQKIRAMGPATTR